MKQIAIEYFTWGWIVVAAIAFILGGIAGRRGSRLILYSTMAGLLLIGLVMYYFKHKP